jgi:uncharacterized protein YkwD
MSFVSRSFTRLAGVPRRGGYIALCAYLGLAATTALARDPTAQEQLMLEMINRMRTNPQAELEKLVNLDYGPPVTFASPSSDDPNVAAALNFYHVRPDVLATQWQSLAPVQPLAWNPFLGQSAATYSQVMIEADDQGHDLDEHVTATGQADIAGRMIASGYLFVGGGTAGENVFAYARSAGYAHTAFAIDWGVSASGIQNPPGHRELIMDGDMREIGLGVLADSDPNTMVGPLVVTQHYGVDFATDAFLTGVAFADVDASTLYTPSEGLPGVTVRAIDALTGNLFETTTWNSGGYSLELPPGNYHVAASGPLVGQLSFSNVIVSSQNVKIDIVPAAPPMPGDANMDGGVDRSDLAALALHFGAQGGALWADGDFDGDRVVGLSDAAVWSQNASAPLSAPSVAVPEPAVGRFLLFAAAMLIYGRAVGRLRLR